MRTCNWLLLLAFLSPAFAERYAVILNEPPLAAAAQSRMSLRALGASNRAAQIQTSQARVRAAAVAQHASVLHSTHVLLNAVYISATDQQAREMMRVPGVAAVVRLRPMKRHAANELELVNAQAGWNALPGGQANAGAGVKIGVIDTGIDQNHPAFQDSSLTPESRYPICSGTDCAFTNKKVIVARSYVTLLQNNPDLGATADDTSPRDRVGHGTAVAALAAGVTNAGPAATITGVAPKAFLGNYKVFGSPGVNDFTSPDVVVRALEDAVTDSMDIVVMTSGFPALWAPGDLGDVCGVTTTPGNNPPYNKTWCDPYAGVLDAASQFFTVVVSAGNDGDLGYYPNLNSINAPGTAPSAITVGSTTNARAFYASLRAQGSNAPASLQPALLLFADGPRPDRAITAPAVDVSSVGDGTACTALPAGSLTGSIALVSRDGNCADRIRVSNAHTAGAYAVVLYRTANRNLPFALTGVTDAGVPVGVIGNGAGVDLKTWLASNPKGQVTLDPALAACSGATSCLADSPDVIAQFSSQGPNIGDFRIKPELVAPGTGMYVATQKYDPNGDLWNSTGYTVVQGTSFSAAMAAGAAAIAKQRFPTATPAQLKSLVVNTATAENIVDYDLNNNLIPARVTAMGAGKLNLEGVAKSTVTVAPSTISFGLASATLPISIPLTITNLGSGSANLSFAIQPRSGQIDTRAGVQLSASSAQLGAGASTTLNVQLTGSTPAPGAYEGAVVVSGGAVPIRIPYLYLVGDGVLDNIYQLKGWNWSLGPNACKEIDFKAVDRYGVPIPNLSYTWTPNTIIGSCNPNNPAGAGTTTDNYGVGWAVLKSANGSPGPLTVTLTAGNQTVAYSGVIRARPTISAAVNAGNGDTGQGVAPGSYITVWGSALSHSAQAFGTYAGTPYLPLALSSTSVAFTGPNNSLMPGRVSYVSDNQVNVVVPWEVHGQSSTQVTVATPDSLSTPFEVKLNDYSPAVFVPVNEAGQVVNSSTAVQRGEPHYLVIYSNGLGPVDHPPATGAATPADPVPNTLVKPTVTIGGKQADVLFSGLTPNIVGLYQINVRLPQDTPTGVQPLVINSAGVSSKPYDITVQ